MNHAARDKAFGRYYARHGLCISRSDAAPDPAIRYSGWAAKYFQRPAFERNPPNRITLNEPVLDSIIATVSQINKARGSSK